ncbi:MAG TPA: Ig-like domain-containing protein [Chitinophagales bacterium]|nr:Ig-like domain-containing protein [Chitinophagales bacterium]
MARLNSLKKSLCLAIILHALSFTAPAQTVSFTSSSLAGESVYNPTCLQFGPDGRLYVTQQNGLIHAYTIGRNGANNYSVTATEVITAIQQIPNHNDDGTLNTTVNTRQVTGLLVTGTAASPVLYVSSSDPRIGGGTSGSANDKNLDTNSGVLSKLTKNGNTWVRTDLVRGLPRSEENHSTNGMQLDTVNNILYLCQGGNTNMGAPSNNFIFLPEYAYSAAILKIDLNAIGTTTYDLPTLDDESRTNTGSLPGYEDVNDPFGGNSGKNQAKLESAGPVQIYSAGWRNPYDLVITQAGRMYSFDNGPNSGWGGIPMSCANNTSEPGTTYCDYLHYITQGYYAGHPNPTRANRANTFNVTNPQSPIPAGMENPAECNYIIPGNQSHSITGICASTNGLTEYTAANFGGSMKGDLLAASFNGKIYRFKLNAAGTALAAGGQTVLASGFGSTPLDVTAQGDDDIFPGTIWAVTYGSHGITVLEPSDYDNPVTVVNTFRINCGGSQYVSVANDTFTGDIYYSGGTISASSVTSIADTDDDLVYKTERYGNFNYDIPVPNGDYQVSLHFAEVWSGGQAVGARVFHVDIEGVRVLNNYDIFARAGGYAAVIERFIMTVLDGHLNIAFTKVVNNAKVCAIEVIPFSNTPPAFTLSGDVYVNEDFPGTQYVTVMPAPVPPAESSQTLTYNLLPASVSFANISFDSLTGLVSITKIPNASGSEMFTITADDGQPAHNTSSETFMLTVAAVNDAPAFTLSGSITVNEDFTGTRSVTVTPAPVPADETTQTVIYSLSPPSVSFANVSINPSTGNVTISKISNGSGTQLFTVTANDGQSSDNTYSQTFTLTVNAVNDAPVFSLSGNITVDEDFTGSRQVTVSPAAVPWDEVSQTVIYSLSPSSVPFANVSINASTGAVSITAVPDKSGNQTFTVTANDGQAQNNLHAETFVLTVNAVNDAPAFSVSGNITVDEDFAGPKYVTVTAAAPPSDELTQTVSYLLSPSSVSFANVFIDASTGKVTVTAVLNQSGSQLFTITADDGQASNSISSQSFMLTVNPVNDAPAFSLSGNVTVDEDFTGNRTLIATPAAVPADEIPQSVTYSLTPSTVSFADVAIDTLTGWVTIAAVSDKSGIQIFTVTANDNQALNNIYSQTFTLTVNPVNDAPSFTLSGNVTVDEDFTGPRYVNVISDTIPADETTQTVTYSLSPSSVNFANVTINASTGKVTVTSIPNQSGSQLFTITANDGQSANNTASQNFTLTINAVNDAPAFSLSGSVIADEDFSATQIVTVIPAPVPADEISQTVAYSLIPTVADFANVSINPVTGTVSISAVPNKWGTQTFIVRADDGQTQNHLYSETFVLTVNPVNDAPFCNAIQDPVVVFEDAINQQITITGITAGAFESQTVAISATSDNPSLIPNPTVSYISPASTAIINFNPAANKSGRATIIVMLNDGAASNNTFTRSVTIIVDAVNDAPTLDVLNDWMTDEDAGMQTVQLTGITAGPFESQPLTVTAVSDNPSLIPNPTVNYTSPASDGIISFSPAQDISGIAAITITVNDGQPQNNTVTRYLLVTVNAVNDPPLFTVSRDIHVEMNFSTTEQVTVIPGRVPSDEIGQVVTYSLQPSSVPFANVSIDSITGTVSVTAVHDSFGARLFTIIANDRQPENNIASATFNLVVGEGNNAPTFSISGSVIENEDFTGTRMVTVTPDPVRPGETGQIVTYTLSPPSVSFANVSIDDSNGNVTITARPNASGMQHFTITANDGQPANNIATRTFLLSVQPVNDAPAFTLSGDILEHEDFTGSRTVTVTPAAVPADELSQTVTYSLNPASVSFADIQFNSATGQVTIFALPDANGMEIFTITAHDGQAQNFIATGSFILTVNEVNDAPLFSISGDISENEDFSGTRTVWATPAAVPQSEASQSVTYSLSPSSVSFANVSISVNTGSVSISSIPDKSGVQQFTITANDGQTSNNIATQTFTLTIQPVNDAPAFTLSGDVLEHEDFTGSRTVTVTPAAVPADELSQTVTYSLSPVTVNFADIQFNPATGKVTIFSVPDANGMEIFTVTAHDGQAENSIATSSFILAVNEVNDAPAFSISGDLFLNEDFTAPAIVTVTPHAVPADEASQTVTYSLSPSIVTFADVQFNRSTGSVTVSAIADSSGIEIFTITANDGESFNSTATRSFILSVNAANDAPYFTLSGNVTAEEDFTDTLTVTASLLAPADERNQPVIFSLHPPSVVFANVQINPVTGMVNIMAVPDGFGTQLFTVTADDGQSSNNTHSAAFTLTVIKSNTPPVFSLSGNVTVPEDFATTQYVQVTPALVPSQDTGQMVTYGLFPSQVNFAQIQFNSSSGLVTINSVQNAYGQQLFTVTANDGQPKFNLHSETFLLTVLPVNDVPMLNPMPALVSIYEDDGVQAVTLTGIGAGADESDVLTLTAFSSDTNLIPNPSVQFTNPNTSGSLSFQPKANHWGTADITVIVNDGQSSNNIFSRTFTVQVQAVNDAPFMDMVPGIMVVEDAPDQVVFLSGISSGPHENDSLLITALSDNPTLIPNPSLINGNSLLCKLQPNATGVAHITVILDDGESYNNRFSQTFTVTVADDNDAPAFSLDRTAMHLAEDFPAEQMIHVMPGTVPADETTQVVRYSLLPSTVDFANVLIDSATGMVAISAMPDGNGSQLFTVIADDRQSSNNIFSNDFMLEIHPVNDPPLFELSRDVNVMQNFQGIETVTVNPLHVPADELNQPVRYSLNPSSANFANVSIDSLTGEISIQAVAGAYGTQVFVVTADDGEIFNNIASDTFLLTVNQSTNVPAISLSGDIGVDEDFTTTEVVTVLATAVSPNSYFVEVRNNEYVPSELYIFQGDIVEWTNMEGWHNVNADPSVYGNNPEGFSNAVDGPGWTFSHQFNIPGTYTYQCDPHVHMGMVGTVTVLPNRPPIKHHVEITNMKFTPKDLLILQGDTVEWYNAEGWHNVNADVSIYPNNPEGFQNAVEGPGWTFKHVFDSPGLYDYQCDPHVYMGMVGTVRVVERSGGFEADTSLPVVYRLLPGTSDLANLRFDSVSGSVLITSKPNRNGSQNFLLIADYGFTTSSADFVLCVRPVDDQPGKFHLLFPANNSTLPENSDESLFSWEASPEVDGEAVSYTLSIHGYHNHLTIANITDTMFAAEGMNFRNDSIYEWWVTATDGISEIECSKHFFFKSPFYTGVAAGADKPEIAIADYPDPFHERVRIQYRLPAKMHVRLSVYNLLGEIVNILSDEKQQAGWHEAEWNAKDPNGNDVCAGMYFYHIEITDGNQIYRLAGSMMKN